MNAHPTKSWELSDIVTQTVQRLMDEGRVSGLDEVVQMGFAVALQEPDPEEAAWMREQIRPVLAKPENGTLETIPSDQAWAQIEAEIARRRGEGRVHSGSDHRRRGSGGHHHRSGWQAPRCCP